MNLQRHVIGPTSCIGLLVALAGCQSMSPERQMRMSRGYIFYCDGAGGGGWLMNWSGGLRQGLIDGGYPGAGEVFGWNTGLGVVADQKASTDYKRGKAREMAQKAADHAREYPQAPVTFMGLSAGTTIVVFGLEEMPGGTTIEDAILFGASISSTYDLTRALRNVRDKMFVFTSEKDSVLSFLVPMAGTADRQGGDVPSAGLRGFRVPVQASAETRRQYAKVVTIPWRPEFAALGYSGGHTDVLSDRFIAAEIAPRITDKVGRAPPALASTQGEVLNPDYTRWSKFGVGTYVITDGYQEHRGLRTRVRLKSILKSKSPDRLLVDREFYVVEQDATIPAQVQSLIAEKWIDPKQHPNTHPLSKMQDLSSKQVTLKGRTFTCLGRSIDADASFPQWGSDLTATVYRCAELPGGSAEIKLKSHFQGEPFAFEGRVVDFRIMSDRGSDRPEINRSTS